MEQPLRCRLGFHKWVRIRHTDPDLDNPSESVTWESTCSYCGRAQSSGTGLSLFLVGSAVIAAVVVFWFLSPLLGALIMIGAVIGILVLITPASIARITRWLSMGR